MAASVPSYIPQVSRELDVSAVEAELANLEERVDKISKEARSPCLQEMKDASHQCKTLSVEITRTHCKLYLHYLHTKELSKAYRCWKSAIETLSIYLGYEAEPELDEEARTFTATMHKEAYDYGDEEMRRGNIDEAKKWFTLHLDQPNPKARIRLGMAEQAQSHGKNAALYFQQAIQLDPENQEARLRYSHQLVLNCLWDQVPHQTCIADVFDQFYQ